MKILLTATDFSNRIVYYESSRGCLTVIISMRSRIRRCEILLAFLEEGERSWLKDGREKPVWVLFHYDERDPLDHQARTEYITV